MTLPCAKCPGLCCGPVPLSTRRLRAIEALVETFEPSERARLAAQRRGMLTCGLYDVEKNQCSVYDQRPQVCRMFGHTATLECPRQPKNFVMTIAPATASLIVDMDTDDVALISTDWDWAHMSITVAH